MCRKLKKGKETKIKKGEGNKKKWGEFSRSLLPSLSVYSLPKKLDLWTVFL
jgi:hypothetical protein